MQHLIKELNVVQMISDLLIEKVVDLKKKGMKGKKRKGQWNRLE
jgi:hypothetical protein